jgi:hypothetical protein
MKTKISITGQPKGTYILAMAICSRTFHVVKSIGGYTIFCPTKKVANSVMYQAFRYLKEQDPECFSRGGIRYSKGRLKCNTSEAVIIDTKIH